jgi:hypothetical protein
MTVRELIEELNRLDPDLHVFVDGYEGGHSYPVISEERDVYLNVHQESWYGTHESKLYMIDDVAKYKKVKGVIL